MGASLQDDRKYSEPFPVTNGVKQSCILAPILCGMMFSAMLTDTVRLGDIVVDFKFRTDKKLFNLRRLQARTKVLEDISRDFLFADDCALNAGTQSNMQKSLNQFAKACDYFGLTIIIKKTKVMYQPAFKAPYTEPVITANGEKLTVTEKFIYFASTLPRSVSIDKKVFYRIAKASSAFSRVREKVWKKKSSSF